MQRSGPRPFVISPITNDGAGWMERGRHEIEPGSELSFDLTLIGRAQEFLPYFVVAFRQINRLGRCRLHAESQLIGRYACRQLAVLQPVAAVMLVQFLQYVELVPLPLRDWGYGMVARFRYRVFGRYDTCPIPPPEQRSRLLGVYE